MREMVKLFNGKSIPRTDYEDALEYMCNSELWQVTKKLLKYYIMHQSNRLIGDALENLSNAIDIEFCYITLVQVDITEELKNIQY